MKKVICYPESISSPLSSLFVETAFILPTLQNSQEIIGDPELPKCSWIL